MVVSQPWRERWGSQTISKLGSECGGTHLCLVLLSSQTCIHAHVSTDIGLSVGPEWAPVDAHEWM